MASIAQPQTTTVARPAVKSNTGLWSWITTVDHKRIGMMYGVSAFAFFLLGGLEALVIRAQLIRPNNAVVDENTYNELFTMHGTTMIFLAIMPLSVAFFNYIMPLQIGARDVAFPRLNAFSFWVFLLGAILLNMSWFFGEAPGQGWYGYAPLTDTTWNPTRSVDFWMLGLQILGVSSMAGAFNFIVTILNMRAPGVTLMRMPIFTWTTLIVSILIVMAFPAITVALFLLGIDRFAGTGFYAAAAGGDPLLWQHLFWIFGHPEVYILVLPAFGIISEIIPTFSRKPLFGYAVMVYATAAIGFLGFGVWVHHMFTTGLGPTANSVFAATTMIIAVPTGVKIFNWIGTMVHGPDPVRHADALRGRPRLAVHDRRALRRHARLAAGRCPAQRLLLRDRPLPLRALRRLDLRPPRRHLLLVPEVHGPDDGRADRQDQFLDGLHRLQRHLLPDALPRARRHAAPLLQLR